MQSDSKKQKYKKLFSIEKGHLVQDSQNVYVSHTGYFRQGNNKSETRGRSRHKNNSKIV